MRYIYFVSYSFISISGVEGKGMVEVTLSKKVNSFDDILSIKKIIEDKDNKFELAVLEVIVLNFVLLREESE